MGQFKFYLLVPHHTPAYSLIANAMLMCRFAPPLAFNFMAALAMPPSDHHTFKAWHLNFAAHSLANCSRADQYPQCSESRPSSPECAPT